MTAPAGSCFGYAIHTPLPFRFLRSGVGEPLEVYPHATTALPAAGATVLQEWPADEFQPVTVTLYAADGAYQLCMGDEWYLIDPEGGRIGVPETADELGREERALGLPMMLCFNHRGDLSLHAAVVQVGGAALIIGAPTQSGKTTLAAAFWREGHRVLSEDLACVRMTPEPVVFPGPTMLRLRPDMAEQLGVASMPGVITGRGRYRIVQDDGDHDGAAPVPVHGVVILEGEADEVSLTRMPAVEAIPHLWELVFRLPEPFDPAQCFAGVTDLAARVPVWALRRPMTVASLPDVVEALASRA